MLITFLLITLAVALVAFLVSVSMRKSRRMFIFIVALGLALAVSYAFLKPTLDEDPRSNLGYLAWKAGLHRFSPNYARLISRDSAFVESLIGKKIEDVVAHYHLRLYDGTTFSPTSYRGQYQELLKETKPDVRCYWFDDCAREFGYCLLVETQRIKLFQLVKG